MGIINQTRNAVLAQNVRKANTPWLRMRGLLGQKALLDGEAMVIEPCNSVHMFFMRFAIDVVFISRNNVVVGCCCNLKPFQLSPVFWDSYCAIELPAGKIESTQTQIGDKVEGHGRNL